MDMKKSELRNIIREEITAIKKDKDKEIFDYSVIISDAWRDVIFHGQEFARIHFDLENNDTMGEKKTFYVKKDLRKNQPVKYEFNAELWRAGGDWEMPVIYFKVEITHDYNVKKDKWSKNPKYVWDVDTGMSGLYKSYVMIPPVEAGNKLEKRKSDSDKYDWFAYNNNDVSKEQETELKLTDADKKSAWKWLQDILEQAVEERHEQFDE